MSVLGELLMSVGAVDPQPANSDTPESWLLLAGAAALGWALWRWLRHEPIPPVSIRCRNRIRLALERQQRLERTR